MSDQMTRSDADSKLRELHERLVHSVQGLIASDDWKRALEFAAHFRSRSFNNTLLIWAQHRAAFEAGTVSEPMPTHVAGFRQWHELGRTVRAGQHGYIIFAPRTARFATSTPLDPSSWRRLEVRERTARFATSTPLDPSSWRRLEVRERPRPGEVVRSGIVGTRPAYVWDVSQTDGPPVPKLPHPRLLEGDAPDGLWEGLASLIDGEGFTMSLTADATAIRGANGQTDFSKRQVMVREDMDAAAMTKTLVHELAHIRLHGPDHEAIAHRGIGEVEAESVALMVAAAHGMDTRDYSIPYVAGWASAVPGLEAVAVVQQTGERARRAAVAILDSLPTEQVGAGDPPGLERRALSGRLRGAMTPSAARGAAEHARGLS